MNINFDDYETSFMDDWEDNTVDIDDMFKSKREKVKFLFADRSKDTGYYSWSKKGGDIEKVEKDPFYSMYYFKKDGVGKPLERKTIYDKNFLVCKLCNSNINFMTKTKMAKRIACQFLKTPK